MSQYFGKQWLPYVMSLVLKWNLLIRMRFNSNFRYFKQISKSLEFWVKKVLCFVPLNSNPGNSNIR